MQRLWEYRCKWGNFAVDACSNPEDKHSSNTPERLDSRHSYSRSKAGSFGGGSIGMAAVQRVRRHALMRYYLIDCFASDSCEKERYQTVQLASHFERQCAIQSFSAQTGSDSHVVNCPKTTEMGARGAIGTKHCSDLKWEYQTKMQVPGGNGRILF